MKGSMSDQRVNILMVLLVAVILAVVTPSGRARAMELEPACQTPKVLGAVLKAAQKLKFPSAAGEVKPNDATFEYAGETGDLTCTYRFTFAKDYDFGLFKVAFTLGDQFELVVKSISLGDDVSLARAFDGWCLPTDDCTGEPMAIKDDLFGTCEDTCSMKNPRKVQRMDAILYDVMCSGDSGTQPALRTFFMHFKDPTGISGAAMVNDRGVKELERCQ